MNDTVTRLMALAEKYAANYRAHYLPTGDENVNITEARQALQDELQKLFTPLSDERPVFTTGHCKEKSKPGGCQLHNIQCGYPACDRKQA